MKATQAQRQAIVGMLRRAEFDTRTVTLMHRRIGVPDVWQGRPLDQWLDTLDADAASAVIGNLQGVVA